jgi:hypothetical protein
MSVAVADDPEERLFTTYQHRCMLALHRPSLTDLGRKRKKAGAADYNQGLWHGLSRCVATRFGPGVPIGFRFEIRCVIHLWTTHYNGVSPTDGSEARPLLTIRKTVRGTLPAPEPVPEIR